MLCFWWPGLSSCCGSADAMRHGRCVDVLVGGYRQRSSRRVSSSTPLGWTKPHHLGLPRKKVAGPMYDEFFKRALTQWAFYGLCVLELGKGRGVA
jgi:hypothetical protein